MSRKNLFCSILWVVLFSLVVSGCSVTFQRGRRSDVEKIQSLSSEIDALDARLKQLRLEKKSEVSQLEQTKRLLKERLKREISDKGVHLEMAEKGLSIVFLSEVLFDSGKADVKQEAFGALDKLARVLDENVKDRQIGIEGHTDNEPIKYSGWKSNWELSTARATSVLHYLVDEKGIDPRRVSATGYGEYRPVASNDTPEGRRENRRVEVVILPKDMKKIEAGMSEIEEQKKEIERQLRKYKK
jgi:chemotaxis protein MotB